MTNATKFCFQRILFLFLFSISISYALDAQKYPSDCFDAYRICALGDYHFANIEGSGSEEDLHLSKTRIKETNSIWLEFTIEQAGDLEFVIVPENQEDDIDFVLYKGDNCSKISPIRVMTSGQIFGAEYFEDCVGQTGLRSDAIDTHEGDGCFDADDNFLKPASLVEGITYYLFINNFNSSEGFSILFSGDDGLEFRNNCENKISLVDIQAYPNPALENITISSEICQANRCI